MSATFLGNHVGREFIVHEFRQMVLVLSTVDSHGFREPVPVDVLCDMAVPVVFVSQIIEQRRDRCSLPNIFRVFVGDRLS